MTAPSLSFIIVDTYGPVQSPRVDSPKMRAWVGSLPHLEMRAWDASTGPASAVIAEGGDPAIRTWAQWDDAVPGFVEIDLVGHEGGNAIGDHAYTLTVTDIATGWRRTAPCRTKPKSVCLQHVWGSRRRFRSHPRRRLRRRQRCVMPVCGCEALRCIGGGTSHCMYQQCILRRALISAIACDR